MFTKTIQRRREQNTVKIKSIEIIENEFSDSNVLYNIKSIVFENGDF